MRKVIPTRCLLTGAVAGAAGSGALLLFFQATARVAPSPPPDAFVPPEPEQAGERASETVARRIAEHLLLRPLAPDALARAGAALHFSYGAGWGVLHALARESWPRAHPAVLAGALAAIVNFAAVALVIPGLRLGPPPSRMGAGAHLYGAAAHAVFAAATAGGYELLRRRPLATLAALAGAAAWTRRLPRPVRPLVGPVRRSIALYRARGGDARVDLR